MQRYPHPFFQTLIGILCLLFAAEAFGSGRCVAALARILLGKGAGNTFVESDVPYTITPQLQGGTVLTVTGYAKASLNVEGMSKDDLEAIAWSVQRFSPKRRQQVYDLLLKAQNDGVLVPVEQILGDFAAKRTGTCSSVEANCHNAVLNWYSGLPRPKVAQSIDLVMFLDANAKALEKDSAPMFGDILVFHRKNVDGTLGAIEHSAIFIGTDASNTKILWHKPNPQKETPYVFEMMPDTEKAIGSKYPLVVRVYRVAPLPGR